MKGVTKVLALVLGMASLTAAAKADPVTGQISINGYDSYNSNTINFVGQGQTSAITATGSLANIFTSPTESLNVDLNSFNFGSGFVNPTEVFTVSNNGITETLTLDAISQSGVDSNGNLTIIGTGTLSETGYTDAAGTFDLTTQGGGSSADVTFSATAVAPTPEPSSLLLMGTGLLGSAGAFFRRRRTV